MMKVKFLAGVFVVSASSCFFALSAVAGGGLKTNMQAYLVTKDTKGKEIFQKAESAEPGQIIEYRIRNHNDTEKGLSNLSTYGPIPKNTEYVSDSAAEPVEHSFLVSIDKGVTFQEEPVVRIVEINGKKKEVYVSPESYTHLRWVAHQVLDADSNQVYRYRVRVK